MVLVLDAGKFNRGGASEVLFKIDTTNVNDLANEPIVWSLHLDSSRIMCGDSLSRIQIYDFWPKEGQKKKKRSLKRSLQVDESEAIQDSEPGINNGNAERNEVAATAWAI